MIPGAWTWACQNCAIEKQCEFLDSTATHRRSFLCPRCVHLRRNRQCRGHGQRVAFHPAELEVRWRRVLHSLRFVHVLDWLAAPGPRIRPGTSLPLWRHSLLQCDASSSSGVGLGSVWCGFMIACYYVLLIAWFMVYRCNSFRAESGHLAWCNGDTDTPCDPASREFLFDKVIHLGSPKYDNGDVRRSTNIVPQTLLALCVSLVLIHLSVFKGARTTGRITYFTMMLSMVFVIFFSFFFGLHEGGDDGIKEYIRPWDTDQISGAATWRGA